jgi:hypothetical protein
VSRAVLPSPHSFILGAGVAGSAPSTVWAAAVSCSKPRARRRSGHVRPSCRCCLQVALASTRGRTLCTLGREGRIWRAMIFAEGHPTTRHRAAHRARVVPRASVSRPSSRVGFVEGRSSLPSRGYAHPSARAVATQCRCLCGKSPDAAVSRCGASTPRHVFL